MISTLMKQKLDSGAKVQLNHTNVHFAKELLRRKIVEKQLKLSTDEPCLKERQRTLKQEGYHWVYAKFIRQRRLQFKEGKKAGTPRSADE